MFSWLEASYYTLIQLVKINHFNAFVFISFMAYLCFQGIKAVRKPIRTFIQLIKDMIDGRDLIKERLTDKRKKLAHFWKHQRDIDWKRAGQEKGMQVWQFIKRLMISIPSFLFLLLGNILFRLIYHLPFVKQDRKRFDKEMKPLLYFKNYRSFVFMGLGFSFIAFILTNYLVTVLICTPFNGLIQ
ncbi:hypothetical protein BKX95_10245 [Streptococcus iniae]|nr:hypothetical protein BKX95_10245 [Streptococcus iniae]